MDYLTKEFLDLLRKHFSLYSTFKRNDLVEFIKKEYKTIAAENSYNWIINDLIKQNIITYYGDNTYQLTNPNPSNNHLAILLDLAKSKKIKTISDIEFINNVETKLKDACRKYYDVGIISNVNMGDELQIIVKTSSDYYKIILLMLYFVYPKDARMVIQFGDKLSQLEKANELLFWKMRERIENMKGKHILYGHDLNVLLDNNLMLIKEIIDGWRESTWLFVYYYITLNDPEKVMGALGLNSKQSYYQRKNTSKIDIIEKVFLDILYYLNGRETK
jgi:hypothetical protein